MLFLSAAYTPASPGDTLSVFRQPSSREANTEGGNLPLDNRTAVVLGATIDPPGTSGGNLLLRCVAAHVNDVVEPPGSLVWTRNGQVLTNGSSGGRISVSPILFANTRFGADLQITAFEESDAGIYQCLATDAASSDSDVATSSPFRLDTGTCTHSVTGGCCVGQCSSSGNDAPLSRPCWR